MESEKNDVLEFINEVIEARVMNRAAFIKDSPELAEVRERILNFQNSIEDEKERKILFEYGALKNEQESIYINAMYKMAIDDVVYILRLIFKTF